MLTTLSRRLLGIAMALNLVTSAQAQMAQVPLLTQSTPAEPNLVFVFDDSGSMDADYMYQYGTPDSSGMGIIAPSGSYAPHSPDVNMMYYDPRILYTVRVNSLGAPLAAGSLSSSTTFTVYFYNPGGSTTKHVSSVSLISSPCGTKYPTSTTVTFSKPPTGGVQATGTVTVSNQKITGVTVTNQGSGYTATATLSFSKTNGTICKATAVMANDYAPPVENQAWNGTGSVSSLSNFFNTGTPVGYLPDAGSPLATGADPSVIYPNSASSSVTKYPKFINRTDCTGVNTSGTYNGKTYCTWAQELQNYANWKLYHATRVDLARTGIGLAFQAFPPYDNTGHELPATFRLGWGTINTIAGSSRLDAGVSLFTQSRKDAFYTWLYGSATAPSGGTPNRTAMNKVGLYYSRSDSNGPWGTTPLYTSTSTDSSTTTSGDTTAIKAAHASCRRSNMLLLTDGYWNDSSPPTVGNVDNTQGPVITGTSYRYAPVAPFMDATSNTLADVAMKYWVTDLRSDLTNNVPTSIGVKYPTWQNVSFYGIGLGIYGTLEQSDPVLASLTSGTLLWPVATQNQPSAIDDMWHAAVNTGGQFLNAGDSQSVTNSISKMMASISKLSAKEAGVTASTAQLTNGTRKYVPKYTTGSWRGNVEAYAFDPVTKKELTDPVWQVVSTDPVTNEAVTMIPDAADRNIVVGNGASTSPKAVNFTYSAMSAAGLTALMTGTVDDALINYLRGDDSNEGDNGIYRTRETLLGDIVNSHPVFVKANVDLLYDTNSSTVPGKSTYRAYVDAKKARAEGVLFVGANDGMLHAFRDGPLNEVVAAGDSSVAGTEVFAYVPYAVLPNLSALAHKLYGQNAYPHKYFVDGRLVETDAYFGSAWTNILLGTTGAGAKAVFALQVPSDPLTISGNNVLWEVNTSKTGFSELGHVLSDVQTGVLPTGEWVAIFGNGYFSASGSASLFVVNLQTGALIQKIQAEAGPNNGLGGVAVVRDDTTKRIIGAYAGDLKGNLWKFDLTSTSSSGGYVGLSGVPLLAIGSTTTPKPMTVAPVIVKHPSGGYVVSIGTGKLFETSDISTVSQQSIYGVWDSVVFGSTVTPTGVTQTGVTNLVQGSAARSTTIDFTCKRGWYIHLPQTGQRVVLPMSVLIDGTMSVVSMWPGNVTTNLCNQSGPKNELSYDIKGISGTCNITPPSPPTPPFCVGENCVCTTTMSSSSCACTGSDCCIGSSCTLDTPPPACGEKSYLPIDLPLGGPPDGLCHYLELTANCSSVMKGVTCPPTGLIRTVSNRQWRQLFMR